MKKFLTLLFLLSCIMSAAILYGQDLSANQMLAATDCKDSVCFNAFITPKGFSPFLKQRHGSQQVELWYALSNDTKLTVDRNNRITSPNSTFIIFVTIDASVRILTTNKNYFETLILQFKTLGFQPLDSTRGNVYYCSAYPNVELFTPATGDNYNVIIQEKRTH